MALVTLALWYIFFCFGNFAVLPCILELGVQKLEL